MAPRTRNNQNRNSNNTVRVRPTHFDSFTNFILFISLFIWAANVSMEATGDLCHSLTNQVIFCGLPPTAVFFLWIATFQEKGIWATSRNGKTEKQYNRVRVMCQWAVFLFIPLTIVILTQAMFMLCRDGCANGVGDGEYCINN